MSYTYADKKRENAVTKKDTPPAQPSLEALRTGAAAPTAEQKGHRVDLPEAMREKMESAFGADLSAVKLYESEAVAEAGANAVTQGSEIAFAPGMLDFSSFGGQSLLGHELSHVVSQARGEVTGDGFLNDHALEARADREGAMAAAGQQVAMPSASLSAVSAAPAAGPMQADKAEKRVNEARDAQANAVFSLIQHRKHDKDFAGSRKEKSLQKAYAKAKAKDAKWSKKLSPDAELPSAGYRTLNYFSDLMRPDPFTYLEDADAAMNIMGEPDDSMRAFLSEDTAGAIDSQEAGIQVNTKAIQDLQYYLDRGVGGNLVEERQAALQRNTDRKAWAEDFARRRGIPLN